jgi:hypothetical protein
LIERSLFLALHLLQGLIEGWAIDVLKPLAQVAQQRAGVEPAPGEFEVGLPDARA